MTVWELVRLLVQYPPDKTVWLELRDGTEIDGDTVGLVRVYGDKDNLSPGDICISNE